MSRGRVVHLVPAAFDRERGILGGAERYAYELARAMARLRPTTLVAFGTRAERFREGPLEVVIERGRAVRGQATNRWSPALLRWVARATVVHCHQTHVLASSTAALACRLSGRRVVTTSHGGGGWDLSAYLDTTRWYHAHLHVSDFSRRFAGHEGRPWAHVIHGGVDVERFAPDMAMARERAVLFVGRLLPHKGVDVLIDALPEGVPLVLVGMAYDRRYQAELERRAEGKDVRFVGGASDAELVAHYRRAGLLVLPSCHRTLWGDETPIPELLGQTALEAMACGTPVLASDVTSLPEVVVAGETGFLFPARDVVALRARIEQVLGDRGLATRLGAAARERILGHFTWPRVVRDCLEVYAA